jgi:predicted GNAT superfamily acetyltransferase
MQIIGGLLRMAGGGEDRPLIVLQDLQPRRDIGGVVVAGFRRDAKIGAEKRRANFSDLS